jgi:outer membrane murein-binding lipoprotein Lpp
VRKLTAGLVLTAALLLTGCSSGIADFDREQRASDKLDLPSRYDESKFDYDSTRWLAERDGFDFYAAKSADGTCLIMVKGGDVDGAVAGCGSEELRLSGGGFPTMHLYIDTPPLVATKSMIELTPNLYVMEYVPE